MASPKREDAAVTGHEPVALAVGRRGHADDRLVQMDGTGRTVKARVTEGEDPAIAGHEPVALPVRSRCHADDRLRQLGSRSGR